jgi:hypothetical protein
MPSRFACEVWDLILEGLGNVVLVRVWWWW